MHQQRRVCGRGAETDQKIKFNRTGAGIRRKVSNLRIDVANNRMTIIGGMCCGISSSIHRSKSVGISEKYASYDAVLDAVLQILRLIRIRRKMIINGLFIYILRRIEVINTESFDVTKETRVYLIFTGEPARTKLGHFTHGIVWKFGDFLRIVGFWVVYV